MSKTITHEGVVAKIEGSQVSVLIVQHSACSGCHARGACTASDQKEKIVMVDRAGVEYSIGESVLLVGSNTMAWSALTYAFILPLLLSMAVLFIFCTMVGELAGVLSVFGVLVVYYFGLFLLRDRLKTKFTFALRKKE